MIITECICRYLSIIKSIPYCTLTGRTFDDYVEEWMAFYRDCRKTLSPVQCYTHHLLEKSNYDTDIDYWMTKFPASYFCIVNMVSALPISIDAVKL